MTTDINTAQQRGDRAPSYDLGAEQAVLGIMLSDPKAPEKVADLLGGEDFYSPKNAEIFRTIMQAAADGHPTEPIAIAGILADRGDLQRLGGGPYLSECVSNAPLAPQLSWYARRITDCAERRTFEETGIKLVQAATSPSREVEDLAVLAQSLIEKAQPRRRVLEMTDLGSLINPGLDDIEQRANRPPGIPTGFTDLDELIGGLRRKQLITIGGATGMGKSIALVDIARHIAIRQRLNVAFFSFEMSKEEIFDRILSAESKVPHHLIRDGKLEDRDWSRVMSTIGPMANAPLFLMDKAPMRVKDIAYHCRQQQRGPGLDVVMVDHMHLVSPSNDRIVERTAIMENVSPDLKRLSMELDVPVVAAAQLNRNPSMRADKTPELTDLKGASSIEQDSNVVILLNRPDYYDKDSPRRGEVDFVVAKSRNSETKVITMAAQLHLSRFVDMAVV
ncbi:replicative DNA helicase [Micromonospora sp. NPDC000207]|uniref:replicative DNA helicase n=1 Tax=Micromonospora sp. NPDC000207 TaxID=3154246 RepID=UPI003332D516